MLVRPFNTYGPRQSARAIIPTIISQLLNGKKSIVLGNLSPTRDLTYVTDTCEGFYEIYNSDTLFGEVTNIGMNSEISIGALALLSASIIDVDIKIQKTEKRLRPENSEVERLVCDNTRLTNNTVWKPKYKLKTGLSIVIEWMKKLENLKLYKAGSYNV